VGPSFRRTHITAQRGTLTLPKKIVIIDGHPDPDPARFCHAIARAYAEAAVKAGHEVQRFEIAQLDFPILRTRAEWEIGEPAASVRTCQQALREAEHVVLIYPLWLGDVPALLKAFLEQIFRPGFAILREAHTLSPGLLKGRSARVIITMGMPALVYRLFFFSHSLRSLRRNILGFVGFSPVRDSVIGNVEGDAAARAKWLTRVEDFARNAN
jgi:putative NADPH-quinone reductase